MQEPFNPQRAIFFDLSSRLKLRLTGSDVFRYLNGQISNDLRKTSCDTAIQASVLNAKGKLNAIVFVSADAESFLVDSDQELIESLPLRLERYIVADDVQIENVTTQSGIFHLIGDAQPAIPPSRRVVRVERFGQEGRDIWFGQADRDHIFQQLSRTSVFCDDQCSELIRIEQGIPRWGYELNEEIIPIEANLEATSIDYEKGCYIGQEVISRMKMSGQTNKRLSGLVSCSDIPLQSGMRLTTNDAEAKEIGWITSAVRSPRLNQEIALGYLKRGFTTVRSTFRALADGERGADSAVLVQVVPLPFIETAKYGQNQS